MQPSQVINEMKSDLFENGWVQGTYQSDNGRCILGSMYHVTYGINDDIESLLIDVQYCLFKVIGSGYTIPDWNDSSDRKFDEVIEVLDKAEKIALVREEV